MPSAMSLKHSGKPTLIPGVTLEEMQAFTERYGLPRISGGSQENDDANVNTEGDEDRDDAPPTGLDEGAKAVFAKEREARKQAAREARELKAELDALKAKQAEADAAKAKADEDEAARKGEFEKLANDRAEALKAVTGERNGLKTQLDTLIASLKPGVDASFKELPEEVAELFTGEAEDVLAKQAFMASHKKLIDRFAAEKDEKNEAFKRFPRTPQPNGNGQGDDAEARKSQASLYRSF